MAITEKVLPLDVENGTVVAISILSNTACVGEIVWRPRFPNDERDEDEPLDFVFKPTQAVGADIELSATDLRKIASIMSRTERYGIPKSRP